MSSYIQWYPGHIAKAERELQEQLKHVDVVFEVLDARIPVATHHPQVPLWIGNKPRILVINRMDMIPKIVIQQWKEWFEAQEETPYFSDAQHTKGIQILAKAAQSVGKEVNQRRANRGMLPRPVRAVVMGFPNVGKSALINRLVGKKVVASARRAGVTRQLRWVRISSEIELLDAPGVIPSRLENQDDAVKLAICEDIGDAAYDNQRIAGALIDLLVELGYDRMLESRYNFDPIADTGEKCLHIFAEKRFKGDYERAAVLLLNDFRKGSMGNIPLELPSFYPLEENI